MTSRYFAWLSAMSTRDDRLLKLAAIAAAFVMVYACVPLLPNILQRPARWLYWPAAVIVFVGSLLAVIERG